MSRQVFLESLDFLERSKVPEVRLLGGEPSLHPDFTWFLDQIRQSRLPLFLFSNGLMPEPVLDHLEKFSPNQLSILINANHVENTYKDLNDKLKLVFERFHESVKLGYTIRTRKPRLDFLVDLIEHYQLRRSVRLGLANPCLDHQNHYLPAKDYPSVGQSICDFHVTHKKKGIQIDFDCGFVACMFPEDFLAIYLQIIKQGCGAIPDILPDGSIIPCYPMESLPREHISSKSDALEVNQRFNESLKAYRSLGIYPECSSCQLKAANLCSGGCLALAMQRLHSCSKDKEVIASISVKPDTQQFAQKRTVKPFALPYVDQPPAFWQALKKDYGSYITSLYLPLPDHAIASGRPVQPQKHVKAFLNESLFSHTVLLNPISLPEPAAEIAPVAIEALHAFRENYGLDEVVLTDPILARLIREKLPDLSLTASTLMDISTPLQLVMLDDIFETLVPSGKIMRDIVALEKLKSRFRGKIRLLVNECCLPGCTFRTQHFYEMAYSPNPNPGSLCNDLLEKEPWLRLTGAWVLPQHLYFFDGLYDELKLAGRVTLNNPEKYRQVLDAYLHQKPLRPHQIGGGPASVLTPMDITDSFFEQTLNCRLDCHQCDICKDYYMAQINDR
jgi:radical SAM protein with 4Fe4S-binding SPASM domain